jgi:hypothetical protein
LELEFVPRESQLYCVKRFRWFLPLFCLFAFPLAARADGIDLPIAIGYGVGIFLPLLLFNATVEAPIMGRFLGIKFSEMWPSWFKANVWSLLAGIPALMVNEILNGWFLPAELGRRFRAYPFFLLIFIFVFFSATCLVEFLYARRIVRKTGVRVGAVTLAKGVLLANFASYVVLGPVYAFIEYPRTDVHEFTSDARWSKQPALTVVAVGLGGQLVAATLNGESNRVVVPYEVRDYVVSADLAQALYRGTDDRFYFFKHGTNQIVPGIGFWCRAPEMDFSPGGKYAAFINRDSLEIRVFDLTVGRFRDVATFGTGDDCRLIWSSKEDTFFLRTGTEDWEIVLEPIVAYKRLKTPPTGFADHYGRVGNARSRDGCWYAYHQDGPLRLAVRMGLGSHLVIWNQKDTSIILRDPAAQLGIEQAVFLDGTGEVLVGVGNFIYILDVSSKRIGPVMSGQEFIALAKPFSKQADF